MAVKDRYDVLCGDAVEQLKKLPANSVQVCVTSPPYYALRDYGTGRWEGGDPKCPHKIEANKSTKSNLAQSKTGRRKVMEAPRVCFRLVCGLCGARRVDKQIGLEESPQGYVDALVAVFEEVRRVLKPDGTCWINIGDSYASASSAGEGIKAKDLIGIPWMLAFAMRKAGWYWRQDIVWDKTFCVPSPVQDRCTTSHEPILLFSKSPKYRFDAAAIAEDSITAGKEYMVDGVVKTIGEKRNKRSVWHLAPSSVKDEHYAPFPDEIPETAIKAGSQIGDTVLDPFMGSGTTGFVALKLGRHFVGVELNPKAVKIAEKRFVRAIPSLAWEMY